jgi:hypothetical protein
MLSDRFRAAVEEGNLDGVGALFHPDAVFLSPVLIKPYEGRERVLKVLRAAERVLGVGERFRYVHQLEDPADRVAILEFATEIDGKQVEGIDKLTFDADGLITELKVMIRPASALEAAPDLSLMAKARAGFHGPYGLGLNQLFRGIGGPEYIASFLLGYTGVDSEQAGVILYEKFLVLHDYVRALRGWGNSA